MKREFKVGDKVLLITNNILGHNGKAQGKVVDITTSELIGVRWDVPRPFFHSCNGKCDNGHGYYVNDFELELKDTKITNWKKLIEGGK